MTTIQKLLLLTVVSVNWIGANILFVPLTEVLPINGKLEEVTENNFAVKKFTGDDNKPFQGILVFDVPELQETVKIQSLTLNITHKYKSTELWDIKLYNWDKDNYVPFDSYEFDSALDNNYVTFMYKIKRLSPAFYRKSRQIRVQISTNSLENIYYLYSAGVLLITYSH